MLDYFKENKNHIFFALIIFSLVILNFIYYYFDTPTKVNQNSQYYENKIYKNENIKTNNNLSEEIVKKNIERHNFKEKTEDIKNSIILFSNISENGKYNVKFVSENEIITEKKSTINYIVISGDIIDKNAIIDRFILSLDENFIYNINDIKIEIEDIVTKKVSICEGTFLNTISPNFSYHIQANIISDIANCYIKSQSDSQYDEKLNNKLIKLNTGEGINIKEELSINEKELEKLKIDKNDYNKNIMFQEQNNQ
ncbi:hypothetical protein PJV93_11375 [Aliarcobacter butzleri]|uniref:LPS export ABC transporter periplasmic protein LptC n=1 Tax=Aliarcobacter butzleri TaxID=28197 RepID=A0AAW7QDM4_9BACT|nr:hypothetical protein [Aliarcobacter butzleri]MDN5108099.1 hypothetical protein [Aliarcobacter butzleri]MDN5124508.1 hypothetical protein [Aliarcobacter butzleri]